MLETIMTCKQIKSLYKNIILFHSSGKFVRETNIQFEISAHVFSSTSFIQVKKNI